MSTGRRWDRMGGRGGVTTFTQQELAFATVRRTGAGPSAWLGLGLMAANTAIALVDLFLLAGSLPK
jgi:hypothetical protein